MKRIQQNGVKMGLHHRRPYLFTGSWFEGVNNINDLHQKIQEISGTEALIRAFNIVCPYEE